MHTLQELLPLRKPALVAIGRQMDPPLKLHKSHNKEKCRELILGEQAKRQAVKDLANPTEPEQTDNALQPANPALEAKLTGSGPDNPSPLPSMAKRGGKREDAGRPKGMTDDRARAKRATENATPNPAIQATLEALFDGWSDRVKCKGLKLTKQEAFDLALPYTNMAIYFDVEKYIPDWYLLGVTMIWNTKAIIGCKIEILKAEQPGRFVKKDRKKGKFVKTPGENDKQAAAPAADKPQATGDPRFISQATLFGNN